MLKWGPDCFPKMANSIVLAQNPKKLPSLNIASIGNKLYSLITKIKGPSLDPLMSVFDLIGRG